MKKIVAGTGIAILLAGCAFNPESMPIGQKDSTAYVDAGAPDAIYSLLLLQQAAGQFVVSVGEAFVRGTQVVAGFSQGANQVEDGPEVEQGYDGEYDECNIVVLDADHQLFQLVQYIVHSAIS